MKIELSKDELAIVMDCLALGQLAKTYNLFNKLVPYMQANEAPVEPPVLTEVVDLPKN